MKNDKKMRGYVQSESNNSGIRREKNPSFTTHLGRVESRMTMRSIVYRFLGRWMGLIMQRLNRMFLSRKGVNPIVSSVAVIGIILVSSILVTSVITPVMKKGEESQGYNEAKQKMSSLDTLMNELFYEAPGATRVVKVDVEQGKLVVSGDENKLKYVLDTKMFQPVTRFKEGNIIISTGPFVKAYEGDPDGNSITDLVLENDDLLFAVRKYGNVTTLGDVDGDGKVTSADANTLNDVVLGTITMPSDISCYDLNKDGALTVNDVIKINRIVQKLDNEPADVCTNSVSINTTALVTMIKNKRLGVDIKPKSVLYVNDMNDAGIGYTVLTAQGSDLTSAGIRLFMNATMDYEAIFTLDAGADFVRLEIRVR